MLSFEKEHTIFIQQVETAFTAVEAFYGVQIPVAEIGYVYDYVKNDLNYKKYYT